MEESGNEEYAKEGQEIVIGQEFDCFPQIGTKATKLETGRMRYASRRDLRLEEFLLPLEISSHPVSGVNAMIFRFDPFDREFSYSVDQRDFDPQERAKKLSEYYRPKRSLRRNHFDVTTRTIAELEENGLFDQDTMKFNPEVLDLVKRLRFQVEFPEIKVSEDFGEFPPMSLEASPIPDIMSLNFFRFYPSDTGPLPSIEEIEADGIVVSRIEGDLPDLPVVLPDDSDKLATIRGRFLLLSDSSGEH